MPEDEQLKQVSSVLQKSQDQSRQLSERPPSTVRWMRCFQSLLGTSRESPSPNAKGRDLGARLQNGRVRQHNLGKKQGARRTSGRLGPKAALEEMLSTQFWSQPRTIGQMREHLETTRGHKYSLQELSPALGRLLRDKKIDRAKNKENQYEYKRK